MTTGSVTLFVEVCGFLTADLNEAWTMSHVRVRIRSPRTSNAYKTGHAAGAETNRSAHGLYESPVFSLIKCQTVLNVAH